MKTNLDAMFKTNEELETKGIKLQFGEDIFFTVKRFGGKNSPAIAKKLAEYYKPHARAIELGYFPKDKEEEILMKIFIESSMIDWEGVVIEDKEADFNTENAIKLFKALPDLFVQVQNEAEKIDNFREELGNS